MLNEDPFIVTVSGGGSVKMEMGECFPIPKHRQFFATNRKSLSKIHQIQQNFTLRVSTVSESICEKETFALWICSETSSPKRVSSFPNGC